MSCFHWSVGEAKRWAEARHSSTKKLAKYCETATAARECGMACCSSPEAAWLGLRLG